MNRRLARFATAWRSRAWRQLAAAWLLFVVTAGVYQVPPALLGGHCASASAPCSLAEEFGLSPAEAGWLPASFLIFKGALALPVGVLLQRWGARKCIAIGSIVLGVVTSLYPIATSYSVLLCLHMGYGAAYCLCGLTPLVCLANSWFGDEVKATSIGLLVTGFSAAGVLWPPLTAAVSAVHGWRYASALLPACTWLVAVPIATLYVADGPIGRSGRASRGGGARAASGGGGVGGSGQASGGGGATELTDAADAVVASAADAGKAGDGRATGAGRVADDGRVAPCRLPWWARESVLYHLGSMSIMTLYIINSLQHLLAYYLTTDAGLSITSASLYSSLIFTFSLAGKVLFGVGLDGRRRRLCALSGCTLLALGGALTLRLAGGEGEGEGEGDVTHREPLHVEPNASQPQLLVFAIVYGLGYGGSFTLVQARAAQLFGGMDGFNLIQSVLAVTQYVGSFLGVIVTAQLRQATHSFVAPFAVFPVLGTLVTAHCCRVYAREGGSWEGGGGGGTRRAYVRTS